MYLKKIKINNTLGFISLSFALIISASLNDFQAVENYRINNNVKNANPTILTLREFDRYNPKIPSSAVKISEITQAQPYLKLWLSIAAIVASIVSLKLSIDEENNADLIAYKEANEQDKAKVDIDFDRALYDHKAKAETEIKVLELHEELLNNAKYKQILKQRINLENGIGDDDEVEDNTHLFTETETETIYYFSDDDIASIKKQMAEGKSIKFILEQFKPNFNSSHPNWDTIKGELVKKLQQGK